MMMMMMVMVVVSYMCYAAHRKTKYPEQNSREVFPNSSSCCQFRDEYRFAPTETCCSNSSGEQPV
jgi:hypothetical protein